MLLEGTDIRALLQQVREEYGPDARIVHAERIRTGGVGGFFAKQRFEVAVEIDGEAAVTPPAASPVVATPSVPTQAPARLGAPLSFDEAVAAVAAENQRPAAPAAPAAPDASAAPRDAIDLVLAALPTVDQAPVAAPISVPAYPAGPAGPVEASLLGLTAAPAQPLEPELPIERAARAAADHGLTPVGPAATAAAQQQAAAAVMGSSMTMSPAMAASAAAARLIQAAAARVDLEAPAAPSATPVPAPVAAPVPAPAAEQPIAPVVPLALAPEPGPEPILVPARPGDVLVLVGDPGPAYAAAVELAARCRIPASTVSVLTARDSVAGVPDERLLHDLLEARLRGAELAHARTAGILVIDAPLDLVADPQGRAWVADAAAVVGATATWAVVDATRRTEDVRRWLGCLPAPEAIVVHGAALTTEPEAVLTLGLPVASHDGLPTTVSADLPITVRRSS